MKTFVLIVAWCHVVLSAAWAALAIAGVEVPYLAARVVGHAAAAMLFFWLSNRRFLQ